VHGCCVRLRWYSALYQEAEKPASRVAGRDALSNTAEPTAIFLANGPADGPVCDSVYQEQSRRCAAARAPSAHTRDVFDTSSVYTCHTSADRETTFFFVVLRNQNPRSKQAARPPTLPLPAAILAACSCSCGGLHQRCAFRQSGVGQSSE
jgi:hypothetical protein